MSNLGNRKVPERVLTVLRGRKPPVSIEAVQFSQIGFDPDSCFDVMSNYDVHFDRRWNGEPLDGPTYPERDR